MALLAVRRGAGVGPLVPHRLVALAPGAGAQRRRRGLHASARGGEQNHYAVLGVAVSATQADIKTAYYERSLQYHPDRNQGSREASRQFQQISDAYAVLGQRKKRLQYDRGLRVQGVDLGGASGRGNGAGGPGVRVSAQMRNQRREGPLDYAGAQFNFDVYYEEHYGRARRREVEKRRERERRQQKQQLVVAGDRGATVLLVGMAVLFYVAVFGIGGGTGRGGW